jgi:hypothetical protein
MLFVIYTIYTINGKDRIFVTYDLHYANCSSQPNFLIVIHWITLMF